VKSIKNFLFRKLSLLNSNDQTKCVALRCYSNCLYNKNHPTVRLMSPSRRYLQEMRIVGRQVMGVLSPWFGPDVDSLSLKGEREHVSGQVLYNTSLHHTPRPSEPVTHDQIEDWAQVKGSVLRRTILFRNLGVSVLPFARLSAPSAKNNLGR